MSADSLAKFEAYTVPSTWMGEFYDHGNRRTWELRMPTPYMRIVGLLTPDDEKIWVANRAIEGVPDQQYDKSDVEAIELPI